MTKELIKYILKILIIAIIIIASIVIIINILKLKSCKDYLACNKNKSDIDIIVTQKELELSKKYLDTKDSLDKKNKEIENLINELNEQKNKNVIKETVIKYIKVYKDSLIINQTANKDKNDILKRFEKFYLNNPQLEIYCYDSAVQKQINLTLNDYDFQISQNQILNDRNELLTKELNLWESKYNNTLSSYNNCQDELQRLLLEKTIIVNKNKSNFKIGINFYIHFQNDLSRFKNISNYRVYYSAEPMIKYKKIPLILHFDNLNLGKFEIKTGIEF